MGITILEAFPDEARQIRKDVEFGRITIPVCLESEAVTDDKPNTFDQWAIVEIMGHARYAGRVTEEAIGGCSFVRVDVPAIDDLPGFTKLFGQSSIFSITPVTRQVAIEAVQRFRSRPITVAGFAQQRLDYGEPSQDFDDYD